MYIIIKTSQGITFEHMTDDKWADVSGKITKTKIIFVSPDRHDNTIQNYHFNEIIWDRYFSPVSKSYEKIIIPYSEELTDKELEEKACILLHSKTERDSSIIQKRKQLKKEKFIKKQPLYEKKLAEHNNIVCDMNELIPQDLDEFSAIQKWKSLNFPQPPADRIKEIKNSYNTTWSKFIEICKKL